MDTFKKYASLVALLALAISIYFVEPGGLWASLAVQAIVLAVVGAGGSKLSKVAVSVVVLGVSGVVAWFQVDGRMPAFPGYGGDVAIYVVAVFDWCKGFIVFATPIVGAAMLTYNLILEKVLKLIGGSIGLKLEPKG